MKEVDPPDVEVLKVEVVELEEKPSKTQQVVKTVVVALATLVVSQLFEKGFDKLAAWRKHEDVVEQEDETEED